LGEKEVRGNADRGVEFIDLATQAAVATRPVPDTTRLDYIRGIGFQPPSDRVAGAPPPLSPAAQASLRDIPAGPRTPISSRNLAHELDTRDFPNRPLRDYVIDILDHGADIHVRTNGDVFGPHLATRGDNWATANENAAALTSAIDDMISRGVLVPTTAPVLVAPLALRFKKNGKPRGILDLSNSPANAPTVNKFIPEAGRSAPTVTVLDVLLSLNRLPTLPPGEEYVILSLDIQHAYNLIAIRPDQCHLAGHYWNGQTLMASNLVFGLASAPLIYSSLGAVILWLALDVIKKVTGNDGLPLDQQRVFGTVFVDDYLLVFEKKFATDVQAAVTTLLNDTLRVPTDPSKTQLSHRVLWVGYEWDVRDFSLHADPAKQRDLCERLNGYITKGKITRQEAQSLAGSLQFTLTAYPMSRAYLHRLYGAIHLDAKPKRIIRIGGKLRGDLLTLASIVASDRGRTPIKTSPDVFIFTDAAMKVGSPASGHAGFYMLRRDSPTVYFGHFEMPHCVTNSSNAGDEALTISSTLFELVGASVALGTLTTLAGLRDCNVVVACDNKCLVESLTVGRAVAASTNRALCGLITTAAAANICLSAVHLLRDRPAIQIADDLSRSSQVKLRAAFPTRPLVELPVDTSHFTL
jgi:hypothetical protein